MQFKIGTDPNANIEPGIIIEKSMNVYMLNTSRLMRGLIKNTKEHIRIMN